MDIECPMYHADQPRTSSAYSCSHRSPPGGRRSSPLRSFRVDRRYPTLTGEEGRRVGQTAVDDMSRTVDSGGCTAWVLSGRPNVSDISASSACRNERPVVVDSYTDSHSRAYQRRSASPSDGLGSCPAFSVQCQRRSHNDIIVGPSCIHAARVLDVDQHSGHRVCDVKMTSNPQLYCTAARLSKDQCNYVEHQRQYDHLSPETLVTSGLDLPQRNNRCVSSRSGNPRYSAYDYSKMQNGHANGARGTGVDGAELRDTVCNGSQRPNNAGVFGRVSPVQSRNLTAATSQSTSYDITDPSSSRLDVTAALSPCLEAHELSLSRASVQLAAVSRTPRRSASTSSSSSSSSTPNIIRRHLKTIAQNLDVRLAALGSGRTSDPVRSRKSQHGPVSTHKKPTLTRSNSEPEALDRVTGSAADDEFGFSSSCPIYRIRALRDQKDDEPPSPTAFVGWSPSEGAGIPGNYARWTAKDAATSSKCSTIGVKSPRSTTKNGPRPTAGGRWTSSSLLHKDNALPKVRCVFFRKLSRTCRGPRSLISAHIGHVHDSARRAGSRFVVVIKFNLFTVLLTVING